MLAELAIRDIVLIDRLSVAFGPGLTILTGETGAGKSILLDAFALALGGRGDSTLVRAGRDQGQVTALFDLPVDHPACQSAQEAGVDVSEGLILRRVQLADGRTRAFINDQPVSVQALRAIGAHLVEIHGQHDDRALVDPASHRSLLDAFGKLEGDATNVSQLHGRWQDSRERLRAEQARIEAALREEEWLRAAYDELANLAPEEGEEERLAAHRTAMQQAERVAGELQDAIDAVSGDHAPLPALANVARRLQRRAEQAPQLIDPPLKALEAALDAVELAGQALEESLRASAFDPAELERTEERLFALRAASRKYNAPVESLPELAARFAAEISAIDAGAANVARLEKEVADAQARFVKAARALSKARRKAAGDLDKAVNGELAPLKLENAVFTTQIDSDETRPGAEGFDRVEFWVQTNPGSRPGPLMKVASGGELARFMLALKVSLADRGSAPCLVFDEIDTGVGGAVADAIGQRLARLSRKVQVLAVTHAPQVAARAAGHMRIAKAVTAAEGRSGRGASKATAKPAAVATRVDVLSAEDRREEIARMLAGATITSEARAAAAQLLAGAEGKGQV